MPMYVPAWRRFCAVAVAPAFVLMIGVAHATPQDPTPSPKPNITAPPRIPASPAQMRAVASLEGRELLQPIRHILFDRNRALLTEVEATLDREASSRRWVSPQARMDWEMRRREELYAPAVAALCREYQRYKLTPADLDVIDAEGYREGWDHRPDTKHPQPRMMRGAPTPSDNIPRVGFPFGGGKAPAPSPDPLP